MLRPAVRALLADAWGIAAETAGARAAKARPVAIGWATVELDRAASELADALGLGSGEQAFRDAPRSIALGCACRIASGVLPNGGSLLVLEPDTEGRLAGALARLGEGPVAVWLVPEAPTATPRALHATGFTLSSERDGPLGPERLIVGDPAAGRLLLLLAFGRATGTIRS